MSDFESVKQILKSQIKNKKDIINKTLPFQTTTSAPYNYESGYEGRGTLKNKLIVKPANPYEKSLEDLKKEAALRNIREKERERNTPDDQKEKPGNQSP